MAKLTKALVQRHAGRPDAYGAALLDIAQDHILSVIADAGLFDTGELVFKGPACESAGSARLADSQPISILLLRTKTSSSTSAKSSTAHRSPGFTSASKPIEATADTGD